MTPKHHCFQNRRIQLDEFHTGSVRFLSGPHVRLGATDKQSTTITILRTGSFSHSRYGRFEITRELFEGMIRNFESKAYGQDIFMDVGHEPQKGSAGDINKLFIEGARLRAQVEWTGYGLDAIQGRGFKYISADFIENYVDSEFEKEHGPVLFGAALVTRPHIKNMDAVQLNEHNGQSTLTYIHPDTLNHFKEKDKTMKKYLDALRKKFEELKLSESLIATILGAFESTAKQLGDADDAIKQLAADFETAGIKMQELIVAGTAAPEAVNINLGDISLGNNDDIAGIVAKQLAEVETKRLTDAAAAVANQAKLHKVFDDAIGAAEGLSEGTVKTLNEARELITDTMTEDQVKKQAEHQITVGNQLEASRQLGGLGYHVPGAAGSVQIQHGADRSALKLQEDIDKGLKLSNSGDNLLLTESAKLSSFARRVLGTFDQVNAEALHEESILFAQGQVNITSAQLPVGFQRTVIREALSDLNMLELVNGLTDPTATLVTQIPYEYRDISQITGDGIVYEGQGIPPGGIEQRMDTAYIVPRKISLKVSNEAAFFTQHSGINFDAYGRTVESNARYLRELIARTIANEYQRSSDAYGAAAIAAEATDAFITVANSTIKTAQFPIVRPHQDRDLQGTAIGNAENPIVLVLNGVTLSAYDGTN